GVRVCLVRVLGLAVVCRICSGRSPFHADRSHLHQRLLSLGHTKRAAVLIMYLWPVVSSIGLLLPLVLSPRPVVIFWAAGLLIALLITFVPLRWRSGRHRTDTDFNQA